MHFISNDRKAWIRSPKNCALAWDNTIFGCDICQDVCPWNRKAPATDKPEFQPREGLVNPALDWLAEISEEDFRQKFRGSPIKRAKRNGLRRNALIAIGNSGDRSLLPLLARAMKIPTPPFPTPPNGRSSKSSSITTRRLTTLARKGRLWRVLSDALINSRWR